jgi:uridine phosphorylase
MGVPVADMMLREVRAVTKGPLLVVRFGSCGAIQLGKPGSVAVAGKGAVMISKNYDYWTGRYSSNTAEGSDPPKDPYLVSSRIPSDQELSDAVCDFFFIFISLK